MKHLLYRIFINNFIINFFIRILGLEHAVYHRANPYLTFKPKAALSTQENAGYSNRAEINEVIEKSKSDLLKAVETFCPINGKILDIGCGPGMYLELFKEKNYQLYATDLNKHMIEAARLKVPGANFKTGDILEIKLDEKFNFIYCIGMLVYIPKSGIKKFFSKISSVLETGGIFYLNYPHAISAADVLYNDLIYIKYSPLFIEELARHDFEILKHGQAFDGRKVEAYDKHPYKSLNPMTDRTYKNSYLLIAKKR